MTDQCSRIRTLLERYLDGELDEKTSAEVAGHLARCPDCRFQLDQLQAVDRILRDRDEPPKLAGDYWDWHRRQVWKRIRARGRSRRENTRTLRMQWMRFATVAAGVAAIMVAVVGGWRLISGPALRDRPVLGTERAPVHSAPEVAMVARGGAAGESVEESRATGDEESGRSRSERRAGQDVAEASAGTGRMAGAVGDGAESGMESETGLGGMATVDRVECEAPAGKLSARNIEPVVPRAARLKTAAALAGKKDIEGTDESAVSTDAGQPSEPMEAEACEEPPELLSIGDLPLVVPEETTTVFVRALVETDGDVSAVDIERSSGVDLLDSVAVSNVRQARFRSGRVGGRAVRCWYRVTQQFRPIDTVLPEAQPSDGTNE